MATTTKTQAATASSEMEMLLKSKGDTLRFPKIGDLVEGTVISASKNEVLIDIEGLTTGIIRGKEIEDESNLTSSLKVGDRAIATVIDLENERGEMELSFRQAGHQKAWDTLIDLMRSATVIESKIIDANKGGLMVKVGNVVGFLPVSQLTTENYPRIEGGDKNKILAYLKTFVNKSMKTKIIDVNEAEEKLIVSEKAAWDEKQKAVLSKYKVGDHVKGKITGVVDFGAFIEFGEGLEGLIHISELAWQRIDDPKTIVRVGDTVEAEIISIQDTKVSLSMKKLKDDPWKVVLDRYHIGDTVQGKILKTNPFGAFVELDAEIHGLAHISELSTKTIKNPDEIVKIGQTHTFKIVSIEPENHRLGLSIKRLTENPEETAATATEKKPKAKRGKAPAVAEETPAEAAS
ncbi:MAG: S1 RNA-binding domain-containing protein [Candidatus Komeilibacteria bacterium]|nr:S1 RNA-binding domain-containing protein [Candidatus Komeilibacteria bacterium]